MCVIRSWLLRNKGRSNVWLFNICDGIGVCCVFDMYGRVLLVNTVVVREVRVSVWLVFCLLFCFVLCGDTLGSEG